MPSLTFTVPGPVRGKSRPRFSNSPYPRAYTPKEDVEWEERIRSAYLDAGGELHEGPIGVHLTVQRVLPKSAPKRLHSEWDTHKPDLDNCIKSVLDALNGAAYKDDSQVTSITAVKLPRSRMVCEEMRIAVNWEELKDDRG